MDAKTPQLHPRPHNGGLTLTGKTEDHPTTGHLLTDQAPAHLDLKVNLSHSAELAGTFLRKKKTCRFLCHIWHKYLQVTGTQAKNEGDPI